MSKTRNETIGWMVEQILDRMRRFDGWSYCCHAPRVEDGGILRLSLCSHDHEYTEIECFGFDELHVLEEITKADVRWQFRRLQPWPLAVEAALIRSIEATMDNPLRYSGLYTGMDRLFMERPLYEISNVFWDFGRTAKEATESMGIISKTFGKISISWSDFNLYDWHGWWRWLIDKSNGYEDPGWY